MTQERSFKNEIVWGDPYLSLSDTRRSYLLERSILGCAYLGVSGVVVLLAKQEQRFNAAIIMTAIGFLIAAYFFAFGLTKILRKVLVTATFSTEGAYLEFHQFDRSDPMGRLVVENLDWSDFHSFTVPFSSRSDVPEVFVRLSFIARRSPEVSVAEMEFPSYSEAFTFCALVGGRFGLVETGGTGFRKFAKKSGP